MVDNSCIDSGSTAWLLTATILVALQTPALALLQAGAVRKKNSLSILLQVMTGLSVTTVTWYLFGYSLSFNNSHGGMIGDFDKGVFYGVKFNDCLDGQAIPEILFATFQYFFCAIATVTISGAWAEKLTFKASILFFLLWPIFCYYPVVNWIWSGGGWLSGYIDEDFYVLDFAGDHTIHVNVGISALVVATMLQKRKHINADGFVQHHNIPFILLGVSLTYIGWFGFNAGSGLAADGLASITLLNTHISAAVSSLVWLFLAYTNDHKFHILEFSSGLLAGLASVTGGSGFIPVYASIIAGFFGGLASYYFSRWIKKFECVDDVLDVASLQLVAGAVGTLIPGFFAREDIGGTNGLVYGRPEQLAYQLIGLAAVLVWSAFWTYLILKFIDKVVGLDISEEAKLKGLDIVEYGDHAYIAMDDLSSLDKIMDAAKNGNMLELQRLKGLDGKFYEVDYDERTPLLMACEGNHLESVKFLLKEDGVEVNCQDKFGNTPLNVAIKSGYDDIANYLRDNGALDSDDHMVGEELCRFSSNGELDSIIKYHRTGVNLNTSDYDQRSPLHIAAAFGHKEIVEYLINNGANINSEDRFHSTPLNEAFKHDDQEIIDLIKENGGKLNEILDVNKICGYAAAGHIREIKQLIETDPKVLNLTDYDRRSLVTLAVSNGHFKLVKYLVDSGADLNIIDKFSMTALDESIKHHNNHIYEYLLQHGAKVNPIDVASKLCTFVMKNDLDTIKHYIRGGVNPNVSDYDGRTMLHIAVSESRVEMVKYLLENDADPMLEDRFKQNAYKITKHLDTHASGGFSTNFNSEVKDLLNVYKEDKENHLNKETRNFGTM